MDVGDGEQRRAVVRVRLDQRSDVDVAGGDDAVERRDDVGERLQRFQTVEVGLCRLNLGVLRVRVALLLVDGLLRHRRRVAQRVPALRGHVRQRLIGPRFGELALSHGDALVEFRGVDDGEDFSLMDLGADVLAPLANVAARLAMNSGVVEGFDIARQHDFARHAAALWGNDGDSRDRLLIGPACEPLLVATPVEYAGDGDSDRHHAEQHDCAPGLDRGARFRPPGLLGDRVPGGFHRRYRLRFVLHIGVASILTVVAGSLARLGLRS